MRKTSFIDYWKLTENFKRGDLVQRINFKLDLGSPYYGLVTAVHRGIGFLDIEWPWGNERMSPEDVIRLNPAVAAGLPSMVDTSYDGYDIAKSRLEDGTSTGYSYAKPWVGPLGTPKAVAASVATRRLAASDVATSWVHGTLLTAASQAFHAGLDELEAVERVVQASSGLAPAQVAESTVRRVYAGAREFTAMGRKASVPNPNNDAQAAVGEALSKPFSLRPGYIESVLRNTAAERETDMISRYLAVEGYIDNAKVW